MPYIMKEQRQKLDGAIPPAIFAPENPGELNYLISRLCHQYIQCTGKTYTNLNAVHGVLACVQQEFYRRITVPYEDEKIIENGDIF